MKISLHCINFPKIVSANPIKTARMLIIPALLLKTYPATKNMSINQNIEMIKKAIFFNL